MRQVKMICFVLMLCTASLFLAGCAENNGGSSSAASASSRSSSAADSYEATGAEEDSAEPYIMVDGEEQMALYPESKADAFNAREFLVPLEDGCEFGGVCEGEKRVFYALQRPVPQGQYDKWTGIYSLDLETGHTELLLEIQNGEGTFYINELICVGDYLFWYYEDADEARVERYSLETGVRDVLMRSEAVYPYVLSGDGRFLTWYEAKDGEINLFAYDTRQDEIFTVAEGTTADSPFTRAYVRDGKTFYLESTQKGRRLTVYDLAERTVCYTCVLPTAFEATRLQTNGEYLICTERYDSDSPLFLLDREAKKLERLEMDLGDGYIFACHLFGDYVVINSNGSNETAIVSLSDKMYLMLPVGASLYGSEISPEGIYCAYGNGGTNEQGDRVYLIYVLDLSK